MNSKKFEDRRFVLEAAGTRVMVTTDAQIVVDLDVPKEVSKRQIALSVPRSAKSNLTLRLTGCAPLTPGHIVLFRKTKNKVKDQNSKSKQ
jgi:hypothetical protein